MRGPSPATMRSNAIGIRLNTPGSPSSGRAGGEVVQYDGLLATRRQRVDDVRTDVAGTTGDEPAHRLLGPIFDGGQLDPDLLQPNDESLPQPVGCNIATAAAGDERFDVLLQTELAQTRRALVEMHAH